MLAGILAFLKAIPAIAGLVDKVAAYFHDKGVKDAQRAVDQRDNAVAGMQEIDKAQKARDGAGADLAAEPGGLREPGPDTAARGSDGIS